MVCSAAMSAAPDPAELAPSRDPAAYGGRPLFAAGFVVWIGLCIACLAVGAAIGRFGWPAPAPKSEPAIEAPSRPSTPSPPAPAPAAALAPSASAGSVSDAGALGDRVARLEAASGKADAAAVRALAAASLSVAAQSSAPFGADLAAFERLAPDDPDLRALAPLAALGAPSREQLGAAFPALASDAAAAVAAPSQDAGLLARFGAMIGRVIIVRRVGPDAPGVDGVLYRAQTEAAAGDLEAALAALRALPAPAAAPLHGWIAAAERRVEIDRRIAAVRARALAALGQPAASA